MPKTIKQSKTHQIEDPKEFLTDMFTFLEKNNSFFPKNHWELKTASIVGSMGQGKSVLLQYIAYLGHLIYKDDFECYQTDDLIATMEYLNQNIEKRKKVLFLFFDDAMVSSGCDSRRSMSSDNIQTSQMLSILRHLLQNSGVDGKGKVDPRVKNGFCFVFYAIQDPNRLDVFIRNTCNIKIYKSHYDNLDKELDEEDNLWIKDITDRSMLKSDYKARGYALGITKTKSVLKFYFPMVSYNIPIISTQRADPKEHVIEKVLELDLNDLKSDEIYGFILELCEQEDIKLKSSDITNIIKIAKWRYKSLKKESVMDYEMDENDEIVDSNTQKMGNEQTGNSDKGSNSDNVHDESNNHKKVRLSLQQIVEFVDKGMGTITDYAPYYSKSRAQLYIDVRKYKNRKQELEKYMETSAMCM